MIDHTICLRFYFLNISRYYGKVLRESIRHEIKTIYYVVIFTVFVKNHGNPTYHRGLRVEVTYHDRKII